MAISLLMQLSKNMTTSLLLLTYFLGFAFCFRTFYGCHWNISTVKTKDVLKEVTHAVIDFETVFDITADVKESNMFLLGMEKKNKYFAYRYSFWLSIECRNKAYTRLMSRQAVTRGLLPFIYICVNKYRSSTATVCSAYQGAMFDPEVTGCINGTSCLPFWMVPLVVDNIIMEITVKTHGIGWPLHPMQFVFGLTNFTLVQFDRVSTSTHEYSEMKLMKYVSVQCTVLLLGPYGANGHFLISTDDFVTIYTATFEQLIPEENRVEWSKNAACTCGTVPEVVDGAAVGGDIILISKLGTIVSSGNSVRRVLNKCVRDMTLTTIAEHVFLILYGGCDDETKVFVASIYLLTGSLTDTVLIGSDASSPCFLKDATEGICKVINIAACTETNYFALVSLAKVAEVTQYAIMYYTGDKWELRVELNSKVPTTTHLTSSLLLEEKAISVVFPNNVYDSETLSLLAFTMAPYTSHHIYLYGSHILHSPDLGRHFYLLPVNLGGMVKFMLVSRKGFLVAITETNVIWGSLAGLSEYYQIYPSSVSTNTLQLLNLTVLPASAKIVSAFFDLHDKFRVLAYSSDSGVQNYVMPLVKLFYYHRQKRNEEASSANQTSSSVCLFSNLRFYLPQSQLFSKQLDHTYYALSIFGGRSYNYASFLIYHAMLQKVKSKQWNIYQDFDKVILDYTQADVELHPKIVNGEQHYSQFFYQNKYLKDVDHFVNPDDFSWDDTKQKSEMAVELPEMVYLNHGDSYNFTCLLTLANSGNEMLDMKQMDQINLYIRLSDVSEVSAFATKRKFSNNNTLAFEVSLVNIGTVTWQNMPGEKLFPVTVDISVANSSLNCFRDIYGNLLLQGYYHTTVMIGCPPALVIEFDWKASIEMLENSSTHHSFSHDCLYKNPAMYCFDFLDVFYPHFNIIDMATGRRSRYIGNYTLRVVFTATEAQAVPDRFTNVEIHKYNNLNSDSKALIWEPQLKSTPVIHGWPVYNMSTNALRWLCSRNSPCSHVRPYFPRAAELYFLIEFSNVFIPSSDTRCNYTMKFWVHLHGLPFDPLYQRLPVVVFVLLMIIALCFLFFACHHNNMEVYMSFCAVCTKYWNLVSKGVHTKVAASD